jgi:NADH:quinone reductase (non-electrogenic)
MVEGWIFFPDGAVFYGKDKLSRPAKLLPAHQRNSGGYLVDNTLFIKHFDYLPDAEYPDFGSNNETYTTRNYMEVESLGPLQTLAPSQSAEHIEEWFLFSDVNAGHDEDTLNKAIEPAIAELNLTGHKKEGRAMKYRSKSGSLLMFATAAAGSYLAWRFARDVQIRMRNSRLQRGKRIVILGAGFGGREVALELAKQLPDARDGEIVLVDQEPFLLFTPMLTEAAGGELDADHIVSPVTGLPKRINFIQARIEAIDLRQRSVILDVGQNESNIPQAKHTLVADHLVLALGAVSNFHNIPGLQEHSFGMKSFDDAAEIRDRALQLLQRANAEPAQGRRRELLTFVVGGAGLTGVETMAAVNDLLRESARKFPNIRAGDIRMVLVGPGKRILPELSEKLAQFASVELRGHGVEIRLNTKVTAAGADFAELNGTERVQTRTMIWAGGITPNPIIKDLDCAHSRHGAVVVNAELAVPDCPGAWALGDSAEVPKPDHSGFYAPTAQNALREGKIVGRNIAADLRGAAREPFHFKPLGELALVGRHAGVARILGFEFKGAIAWAMWRLIYWSKMPSLPQRMRILSDWALDLVFGRNLAPLPPVARQPRSVRKPAAAVTP